MIRYMLLTLVAVTASAQSFSWQQIDASHDLVSLSKYEEMVDDGAMRPVHTIGTVYGVWDRMARKFVGGILYEKYSTKQSVSCGWGSTSSVLAALPKGDTDAKAFSILVEESSGPCALRERPGDPNHNKLQQIGIEWLAVAECLHEPEVCVKRPPENVRLLVPKKK